MRRNPEQLPRSNLSMNAEATGSAGEHGRSRLRFELIFASLWLAFGLFILPALIYTVGVMLLGPYGETQGMGSFYADFFGDLVEPSARVWTIALGPLVLVSGLRLLFLDMGRRHEESEPDDRPPPTRESRRVEPRVSSDS